MAGGTKSLSPGVGLLEGLVEDEGQEGNSTSPQPQSPQLSLPWREVASGTHTSILTVGGQGAADTTWTVSHSLLCAQLPHRGEGHNSTFLVGLL